MDQEGLLIFANQEGDHFCRSAVICEQDPCNWEGFDYKKRGTVNLAFLATAAEDSSGGFSADFLCFELVAGVSILTVLSFESSFRARGIRGRYL